MKHQGSSSVRLFKSDFLEQFTHVHPILPLLMWAPVVFGLYFMTFRITALGIGEIFGWSLLGLLAWTLTEYVLHRFAFHYPATSSLGKRFVYLMHGLHHDDPNDGTRLVMPPLPAIIYSVLLYPFFRMAVGEEAVLPFFGAFLFGYLCYDYTHYYVHHFIPQNRLGKYLKKYHMTHHFRDHDGKWGVSSPLWDYVWGTVEVHSSRHTPAKPPEKSTF